MAVDLNGRPLIVTASGHTSVLLERRVRREESRRVARKGLVNWKSEPCPESGYARRMAFGRFSINRYEFAIASFRRKCRSG